MKTYGDRIGAGNACIVVRDEGFDKPDHPFWDWLRAEGFKPWGNHGHYDKCNWAFINLDSMIYAPGMPGIKITDHIRERRITIAEFKQIWNIFKLHEDDDYSPQSVSDSDEPVRIMPAVKNGARLCHIYEIDDAKEAYKQLDIECVKSYGEETKLEDGTLLHDNYEWDDGFRSLLRCKCCGGLILFQVSGYTSMSDDADGYYEDIIPVWSEEEADLLNILLGPRDFADHPFRHLRGNNHEYHWTRGEQPRPMDINELKRAIALKYRDKLNDGKQ